MKVKDFITGLFILLVVGAMLTSCKKEPEACGCGVVTSKGGSYYFPYIYIIDECSGEDVKIDVHRDEIGLFHRGQNTCN